MRITIKALITILSAFLTCSTQGMEPKRLDLMCAEKVITRYKKPDELYKFIKVNQPDFGTDCLIEAFLNSFEGKTSKEIEEKLMIAYKLALDFQADELSDPLPNDSLKPLARKLIDGIFSRPYINWYSADTYRKCLFASTPYRFFCSNRKIKSYIKKCNYQTMHSTLLKVCRLKDASILYKFFHTDDGNDIGNLLYEYGTVDLCVPNFEGETFLNQYLQNKSSLHRLKRHPFLQTTWRLLIQQSNCYGETPLHIACQFDDNRKNAQSLLNAGAEINAQDNNGETPLHHAIDTKNDKMVSLLLKKGADIHIKNNNGDVPLNLAVKHGAQNSALKILDKTTAFEPNKQGHTCLHMAALYWRNRFMDYAHDKCDFSSIINDQSSPKKQTLLILACINKPGSEGVAKRQMILVRKLLKYGADATLTDSKGHSAIHYAKRAGAKEVINLLKKTLTK